MHFSIAAYIKCGITVIFYGQITCWLVFILVQVLQLIFAPSISVLDFNKQVWCLFVQWNQIQKKNGLQTNKQMQTQWELSSNSKFHIKYFYQLQTQHDASILHLNAAGPYQWKSMWTNSFFLSFEKKKQLKTLSARNY